MVVERANSPPLRWGATGDRTDARRLHPLDALISRATGRRTSQGRRRGPAYG